MAGSIVKILSGISTVYWTLYGSGSNTPITANAVSWSSFTPFGFKTVDGLTSSYTPELNPVDVEEHNGPVDFLENREGHTLSFTLQESDLLIHALAYGQGTFTAGGTPGTNPDTFTLGDGSKQFYSLGFEGINPAGLARVVFFPKVLAVGAVEKVHAKGTVQQLSMEFTSVFDLNEAAGARIVQWTDITAA